MKYQEIKNEQPILRECFFAFSKEQFEEGVKKHNLEGKKLYRGFGGLIGTKEGIEELNKFYDNMGKRIGQECNPQEVYNYEFGNHECSYTNNDSEPMKIILCYFTEEQCRKVKRRFGHSTIEKLFEDMKNKLD